jgi:hypothetical protein
MVRERKQKMMMMNIDALFVFHELINLDIVLVKPLAAFN